jgi:hypothetical protein
MRRTTTVRSAGLAAAAVLALISASWLNSPQAAALKAPIDAGDSACTADRGDDKDCILLHMRLNGRTTLWVGAYRTVNDFCNGRRVIYTATRRNSISVWIRKSDFTVFEMSSTGDTFDTRRVARTATCPSGRLTYIPVDQNLCWRGFPLVATGDECDWR